MENTPNLNLPYIAAAQAQKHVTHNEAIRSLDAIVQLSVLDRDLSSPPVANNDGDRYIVDASASGAWQAQEGKIAAWQDGAWAFHIPQEGWICWISDENIALGWDGANWVAIASAANVNPTNLVGINTMADSTNRLSLSSPASLFNHQGSDHHLKINKNDSPDTASILFQNNFDAHAEIGLVGSDNIQFKVSPDGSTWKTALEIDRNSGEVSLPFTSQSTGSNPNLLINGDMAINQRNFSGGALSADNYGFDRWKAGSGGCTLNWSAGTITLTSGDICQVIEKPALENQIITLSVEDLSGGNLDIDIEGVTAMLIAGSGQCQASFTLPSGSTGNITVSLSPASTAVTFKNIKLENGSSASPWSTIDTASETNRCLRYYQRLGGASYTNFGVGVCVSSTKLEGILVFHHMRAKPSFNASGSFRGRSSSVRAASGTPTLGHATTSTGILSLTTAAGLVAGQSGFIQANGSTASYLELEAEL